MPEINLDTLTDMQFDVLKEIGNIGAGNATTALSQMINMKIDMNVPKVALVPLSDISGIIGSEEMVIVGIMLGMEGDITGTMMFLLKVDSAHRIVNLLMGTDSAPDADFGEMEYSALGEIGNIIAGSYLSALSSLTGLKIVAGAILSVPAIEYGKIGDKVLFIETQLGEDDFLNGYIVMVPEVDSYGKILTSLGIEI